MKSSDFYRTTKHFFGEIRSWHALFIVMLVYLFFSWFPDSIKDMLIHFLPDVWVSFGLFSVSATGIIIFAFWLKNLLKKIEFLKYGVETYDVSELKYIKVIITGLSIPREDEKLGHNWSQQETLIKKCIQEGASLKKVIVIPSYSSAEHFSAFERYIRGQINLKDTYPVFKAEDPVDYEDLIGLQKAFNKIVEELKEENFKEKQILIDITAGTKTFSIVASSITFDNDIRMCYVNNAKQVIIFDMVLVKKD